MAVFKYTASKFLPEEFVDGGFVVAPSEAAVVSWLRRSRFEKIRVVRLRGLGAVWRRISGAARIDDLEATGRVA
jgi:hypothetical protein